MMNTVSKEDSASTKKSEEDSQPQGNPQKKQIKLFVKRADLIYSIWKLANELVDFGHFKYDSLGLGPLKIKEEHELNQIIAMLKKDKQEYA